MNQFDVIKTRLREYEKQLANERFDKHIGLVDTKVDDWPEGFAYEARTVNEFELEDGDIDDVVKQLENIPKIQV